MMHLDRRAGPALLFALMAGCHSVECGRSGDTTVIQEVTESGVTAALRMENDWGAGYCATVMLQNESSNTVAHWTVVMNTAGATVNDRWNGKYTQSGSQVTVHPASDNAIIHPGSTTAHGFCAAGSRRPKITTVRIVRTTADADTLR